MFAQVKVRTFNGGWELRRGLRQWRRFCNHKRPQQALNNHIPDEIYCGSFSCDSPSRLMSLINSQAVQTMGLPPLTDDRFEGKDQRLEIGYHRYLDLRSTTSIAMNPYSTSASCMFAPMGSPNLPMHAFDYQTA